MARTSKHDLRYEIMVKNSKAWLDGEILSGFADGDGPYAGPIEHLLTGAAWAMSELRKIIDAEMADGGTYDGVSDRSYAFASSRVGAMADAIRDERSVRATKLRNADVVAYLSGEDVPGIGEPPTPEERRTVQPDAGDLPTDPTDLTDLLSTPILAEPSPADEPIGETVNFAEPTYVPAGTTAAVTAAVPEGERRITYAELFKPVDPTTASPHRSVSQVEQYAGCGLKYRLSRRTAGVTQRPGWALVGGIAFHDGAERIEREIFNNTMDPTVELDMDEAKLKAIWDDAFGAAISATSKRSPAWPMEAWHCADRGREGFTWWSAVGPELLGKYLAWSLAARTDGSLIMVGPDPLIESQIDGAIGGIRMTARIDQLRSVPGDSGRMLIVDLKSGKRTPSDNFQLKAYAVMLSERFGMPIERFEFGYYMAREGAMRGAGVATNGDVDEVIYRVSSMDGGERAGIYAPAPGPFCSACSVAHVCPARG